jgi:hypothetical protein
MAPHRDLTTGLDDVTGSGPLFLFDARRRVIDVKDLASALSLPLRTTYRFGNTLRKGQVLLLEEGTGRRGAYVLSGNLLSTGPKQGALVPQNMFTGENSSHGLIWGCLPPETKVLPATPDFA